MCAKLNRKGDNLLTINTEYKRGIMFVRLKGELTKDTVNKLDKKVINKIENLKTYNLVFNVTNLKIIDYKGINKLLYSYEIVKKNKGKILLCGNNLNIKNRLKKSRILNYIFEISDEIYASKYLKKG